MKGAIEMEPNLPDASWDDQQTALGAHMLQTSAWAAFQKALGKRIFYSRGAGWSWLAVLERNRFGTRLYCPYGPTAHSVAALRAALESLATCATKHNAHFVRIEPTGPIQATDLRALGLHKSPRDINPRHTWTKDLRKSQDELLAEMSATNRNLYRTASKKGLSFRHSTQPADIKILLEMIHEVAARAGIQPHPDAYYIAMAKTLMPRGSATLFIAEHEGKAVSASLALDSPATRYYAHAGARDQARKLHPGTPLLAHMIFDAKAAGKQTFDFFGIAPPDQPNHAWRGFTAFKQSFGGHDVEFAGTWELPIKKAHYHVYKTLRSFGR